MLDDALQQIAFSSSARGLDRHFRVGPAALPFTDASYVHTQATFLGIGLRPYSPVHCRWRPDSTGGHVISWIRRTRIDGDLWDLPDVPLGEAVEAYAVRVWAGNLLVRQDVVGVPTWTYTATQRAGDGIGLVYDVEVAQISDRFGPGPFTRITIHG